MNGYIISGHSCLFSCIYLFSCAKLKILILFLSKSMKFMNCKNDITAFCMSSFYVEKWFPSKNFKWYFINIAFIVPMLRNFVLVSYIESGSKNSVWVIKLFMRIFYDAFSHTHVDIIIFVTVSQLNWFQSGTLICLFN